MKQSTKKLNRVKLINWMYFSSETIPINMGSVLISGENAAGKSTILDAIQMVLTGNSTKFNKAANENSDRDLKSYVRCKIDTTEKTYLREGNVISNIALEFYEEKENRFFVIGVHLISANENDAVAKKWYIEQGKLEDFSFLTDDNKPSLPNEFMVKDKKIVYIKTLSDYKEKLRHRLGNLEEKFFEVLLKALAFRPVDNVKDFINRYVLTEKNIDVQSLRESIDVLNEIEKALKKAQHECAVLEEIKERFNQIDENRHNLEVNDMLLKIIDVALLQTTKEEYETRIRVDSDKLNRVIADCNNVEIELTRIGNKINNLKSNTEYKNYKELINNRKQEILSLENDMKMNERRNSQLLDFLRGLGNYFSVFSKHKSVPFSQVDIKQLASNLEEERKVEIIDQIESFLTKEIEEIHTQKSKMSYEQDLISKEIQKISSIIKSLESEVIPFPAETEKLRRIIQEEFNTKGISSKVYVLSELLSIKDKSWTNAIEGYLNVHRFYLIVEPEYYNLALEIYNANKKSHSQGIINFRKVPNSITIKDNSLAVFVETKNRYAHRYINYILGNVICCDELTALENYDEAITKECMVYKDYVLQRIDPSIYHTPYIGKDAVKVQLKNARDEHKSSTEEFSDLRDRIRLYDSIIESFKQVKFEMIKQNMDSPNKVELIRSNLEEEKSELEKITKNPDIIELQSQIKQAEKREDELKQKQKQLIGDERTFRNTLDTYEKQKNEITSQLENKKCELNYTQDNNISVYNEALEKYNELIKNRKLQEAQENYNRQKTTYEKRGSRLLNGDKSLKGLYQMQNEYNQNFSKDFMNGMEGKTQFIAQFNWLNSIGIGRYQEEVYSARENFEDIFKNEFLSKMKESIESARDEFDSLKKALKDINYGEDSYKFTISPNDKKRNLYNMIMADNNLGTGSIFSDNFETQYKEEIDELFSKIKERDSSDITVREYTDYRTYLDYDIEIHKKNGSVQKLSQKAKSNSGGESQVPFYVIMAASLNNIYKSNNSIRLLLLDEAFNNMDEQRITSVMKFFNELNFQTILVAPTPKIQDIEENVDSVLTVMREDTISFVEDFKFYGE